MDKTPEEIFHQDFKVFTINNLKVGVSQVGTLDLEIFQPFKEDMIKLMDKKVKDNNFALLVLMVTDIIKGGSELIVAGAEKEVITRAFNAKLEENSVYLPGIISRKKQIIPPLTTALSGLNNA